MTDETQNRPVEALLAVCGGLPCHQLSGRNSVNKRAQTSMILIGLRHAAEDTPSGAGPGDIEKTPVFDRAGQATKI